MIRKRFLFTLLLAGLNLLPLAWESTPQASQLLRVGIYNNPPLEYVDSHGEAHGLVVDLLEAAAQEEGWVLDYVPCEWPNCIHQLETGQIDLMGAIAYTPTRSENLDFNSETYLVNWGIIYARAGTKVQSLLDLDGKTLALLREDIHAEALRDLMRRFGLQPEYVEVQDYHTVLRLVSQGEADLGLVNRVFGTLHENEYDVRRTPIVLNPIEVRFAATKGKHADVLAALDAHLRAWKQDPDSPYYHALDRWLPLASPAAQTPPWLQEIIVGLALLALAFLIISAILRSQVSARTQALRQSEEKYRRLVELSPDAIAVYSDGKIVFVNPAAVRLMHAKNAGDLIGKPVLDIVHPDDHATVLQRVEHLLTHQTPQPPMEERLIRLDGSVVNVEVSASPITYQGKPAVQVLVRDITGRKQNEALIRQRFRELQSIYTLSTVLSRARTDDEIYTDALAAIANTLKADRAAILLFDADDILRFKASQGLSEEYRLAVEGHSPWPRDAQDPQPILVEDVFTDASLKPFYDLFTEEGIRSLAFLPLIEQNRLIGKLVIYYDRVHHFTADEIRLAQTIAGHIAFAAERKRSEDTLHRRLEELRVLHAVAIAGTTATTVDELIQRVTDIVGDTLYPDNCGVLILSEDGKALLPHPSYRGVSGKELHIALPLSQGISGRVVTTGRAVRVGDVTKDEGYVPVTPGIHSELCVPIRHGEKILGVFNAESKKRNAFNEDDERLLNTIAGNLASAIERLRLFEQEKRRRQEAETLRHAAATLTSSLSLDKVLDNLLEQLEQVIPYDSATVFIRERDGFRAVAARGFRNPDLVLGHCLPENDPLSHHIYETQQPIVLPDAQADSRFQRWGDAGHIHGWMGIPLIARGRVLGHLTIDSHRPNAYNEADAELALAFANHAAIAIENARLFEAEQRRRQEAETLRQAAAAVASTLDRDRAIQLILDQLARVVPYDSASVQILGDGYLEIVGGKGWPDPEAVLGTRFPIPGDNPNTIVVQKRRPHILRNAPRRYAIFRSEPHAHIRSWLGVPLIARDRVIGILALDSTQPHFYTREHARLVSAFAAQAAIAIENARLFEAEQRRAGEFAALYEISQSLRGTQKVKNLLETVVQRALELLGVSFGCVYLYDRQREDLELAVTCGSAPTETLPQPGSRLKLGEGLAGHVAQTRQPLVVNDPQEWAGRAREYEVAPFTSLLEVPMLYAGELIGVLVVNETAPRRHRFDDADMHLLTLFAAQAAGAVYSARQQERMQRRLAELEAVNRVSTAMRMTQTLDEMLTILLDATMAVLGTQAGGIWLYDKRNDELYQAEARGWFANIPRQRLKTDGSIVGHVQTTGEVYLVRDFKNDPHISEGNRGAIPDGWEGICAPIRTHEETLGVIFVAAEKPHAFSQHRINVLSTIAEMAGIAIHRTRLHERVERQLRRLVALRDVDMAIASSFDLRVTLNILVDHALNQLGADAVAVLLFDPESKTLAFAEGHGFLTPAITTTRQRIGEGLPGISILERKLIHSANLRTERQCTRRSLFAAEGFVTYHAAPLISKGQIKGVLEIFHRRPFHADEEWEDFLDMLANQAAIAIDSAQLLDHLQRSHQELSLAYDTTLAGWSQALELRDQETKGHTLRVVNLTIRLAQALGVKSEELTHIRRGVLLHDIGKLGIPDHILNKPDPLTEEERKIIQQHVQFAYDWLSSIPYLRPALDIPYCHHERWDGSGYPRGLKGEQIPLAARIFAVVDVYDALCSDRPYRKAWPREKVIQYIREQAGKLFDPHVVEAFLKIVSEE